MAAQPDCSLKVNRVYATVSSLISFYLPLPIMFYVYLRILLIAERQSREIKQLQQSLKLNGYSGSGSGNGGGGRITKTMASFEPAAPSHQHHTSNASVVPNTTTNKRHSSIDAESTVRPTQNGGAPLTSQMHANCLTSSEQLICQNVITTSSTSSSVMQSHLSQLRPAPHAGQRSASCGGGCACSIVIREQLGQSTLSTSDRLSVSCGCPSCCTLEPLDQKHHRKCSDTSTTSGSCSSSAVRCSLQIGLHGGSGLAGALLGVHAPMSGSFERVYGDPASNSTTGSVVYGAAHTTFARGSSVTAAVPSVLDELRRAERQLRKRSKQILTDTKAIRTLGIVMGVFVACWLPFFIMYLLNAYAEHLEFSYEVRSAITWLGYFNSSFNPCIYALLNKEFQLAFRRVLHCAPRILVQGASRRHGDEPSVTGVNRPLTAQANAGILADFNSVSVGGLNSHGLFNDAPLNVSNNNNASVSPAKRMLAPFAFGVRRARFLGRISKTTNAAAVSRQRASTTVGCLMQELSSSGASHSCTKELYDPMGAGDRDWMQRADSIGAESLAAPEIDQHLTLNSDLSSVRPENNHRCNGNGVTDTSTNSCAQRCLPSQSVVKMSLPVIKKSPMDHHENDDESERMRSATENESNPLFIGQSESKLCFEERRKDGGRADTHQNSSDQVEDVLEVDEEDEDGPTAQHVAADLAIELQLPCHNLLLRPASSESVSDDHKSKAERRRQKIASQTRLGVRLARFLDTGRLNRRRNRLPVSSSTKRKRSDAKLIAM